MHTCRFQLWPYIVRPDYSLGCCKQSIFWSNVHIGAELLGSVIVVKHGFAFSDIADMTMSANGNDNFIILFCNSLKAATWRENSDFQRHKRGRRTRGRSAVTEVWSKTIRLGNRVEICRHHPRSMVLHLTVFTVHGMNKWIFMQMGLNIQLSPHLRFRRPITGMTVFVAATCCGNE